MAKEQDYEKVLNNILKRIKPTPEQEKKLEELSKKALEITNRDAKKLQAKAILAGSVTRGTWLPGKNEFDVFVIFPKNIPEERLEKLGLDLGKSVIEELGGKWRIEYAQHPYIRGTIKNTEMDIVPCYEAESGEKIISAVDRTPFHVEYLNNNLPEKASDEVRLLKYFLRVNGIYGADAKTQGFSGYLCELLIIRYKGFTETLRQALRWRPGDIIDIEKYWNVKDHKKLRKKFKDEVLRLIDPVDKNRNVAAAVSAQSFYKFKKIAKAFLDKPTDRLFSQKEIKPFTKKELDRKRKSRETELILVKFKPPKVVPDILWPQLRKTTKRLEGIMREYEFNVMRSDCWTDDKNLAVILLEMEVSSLPMINKRIGPFVFDLDASVNFIKKYEKEALTGPFIEENNWCVEIKRKWRDAKDKLKDSLRESENTLRAKGIPNYIAKEMSKRFEIVEDKKIGKLMKNKGFCVFLREYFKKEKLMI